jgi:hypothetical protein
MRNVIEIISNPYFKSSLVSLETVAAAAGKSPVQNARISTFEFSEPRIEEFSSAYLKFVNGG